MNHQRIEPNRTIMSLSRSSSQRGLRTVSSKSANSRRTSLPYARIQEGQPITSEVLDLKIRLAAALAQIDAEKHDNRVLSELVANLHEENEELRGKVRRVPSNSSLVSLDFESLYGSSDETSKSSHKSLDSSKSLSSSLLSLASRRLSQLVLELANEEVPEKNEGNRRHSPTAYLRDASDQALSQGEELDGSASMYN